MSAKIRFSLQVCRKKFSSFSDPDIHRQYTISVKNKLDTLQVEAEAPSATFKYNFVTAHEEAAKEIILLNPKIEKNGFHGSHLK